MKVLQGLTGTIASLTNVVIALLGLGIVVSLLGGNVPFVGGVADNIVGLVQEIYLNKLLFLKSNYSLLIILSKIPNL